MATVKGRGNRKNSISGFFRQIFVEKPDLLNSSSNQELIARWCQAHPNHSEKLLKKVKANLANLKSQMRKKEREGGSPLGVQSEGIRGNNALTRKLEVLEEQIDDCMSLAKNLDRAGLDVAIRHLRRARNHVVWKIGGDS